jgi:DNA ligase-1
MFIKLIKDDDMKSKVCFTQFVIKIIFFFLLISPINSVLAQPPKLLLANTYQDGISIDQYLVSEKLDGVRAYWDGEKLVSRRGYQFFAPQWFVDDFPNIPLDGELWIERGKFEAVSSAVRKLTPIDSEWRSIKYMVFDLPGDSAIFSERYKKIKILLMGSASSTIYAIEQRLLPSRNALFAHLTTVVSEGGEGLMLHRKDGLYQVGRSDDLLKLKLYQDAEATVIKHLPGQGKYQGMMGSVLVQNEEGVRFRIGSGFSDELRRDPPALGAVITYKYFGKTKNNVPKFASFLRKL